MVKIKKIMTIASANENGKQLCHIQLVGMQNSSASLESSLAVLKNIYILYYPSISLLDIFTLEQ